MKKIWLSLLGLSIALLAFSQNPVSWSFTAKKTSELTFEIHIAATIANPWTIYSQHTPDGGPLPTKISFSANPMVKVNGTPKEVGSMQKKYEEVFEVNVLYYKSKVEFVQTVKLKKAVKTNVAGSVEFMACTEEQCLPARTIPFNIPLEN